MNKIPVHSFILHVFKLSSFIKNNALLYSRVGAGAAGAAVNFYPESHKNYMAPQHCW
jgi:hypothetical protein